VTAISGSTPEAEARAARTSPRRSEIRLVIWTCREIEGVSTGIRIGGLVVADPEEVGHLFWLLRWDGGDEEVPPVVVRIEPCC
jgi:hypothetical protein